MNNALRIAEAVRAAAYDSAGISGLCHEDRWEAAVHAIRALDTSAALAAGHEPGGDGPH